MLPKTIKIGPWNFTILAEEKIVEDNEVFYGLMNMEAGEIKVATGYTYPQAKMTLLHEVIHGIDNLFGIKLKEKQVEALTKGLYMVLSENELLVEGDHE